MPRTPLTLIAAALLSAAAAAPATAADYDVNYCAKPDGKPSSIGDDWTRSGDVTGSFDNCVAPQGGFGAIWTDGNRARGNISGWTLDTANGLRIVGARGTYDAAVFSSHTAADVGGVSACVDWGGAGMAPNTRGAGEHANFIFFCDTFRETDRTAGPLDTTTLRAGLTCVPPPGSPDPCTGSASLSVKSYVATIRDADVPLATQIAGSLVATDGRILSGQANVTAVVSDTGSGARQLALLVDGQPAGEGTPACTAPFTRMRPCPDQGNLTAVLDTTKVPDGQRLLTVLARDAAGNEAIVWTGPILVQNNATIGASSDPLLRGKPNGQPVTDTGQLTAWWPGTAKKASSSPRARRRCANAAYRKSNNTVCAGRPAQTFDRAKSGDGPVALHGRLVDATGAPIIDALIKVTAQSKAAGQTPRDLPSVTTDAEGRWRTTIDAAQGSQDITVSWRARDRDTLPATSTTTRLRVAAQTTLNIGRRGRGNRTLVFSGQLLGQAGDRAKVAIRLQVRQGGRWRTFATPVTRPDGTWDTQRTVRPARLRFRAQVLRSGAYPFEPSRTKTRRVNVR